MSDAPTTPDPIEMAMAAEASGARPEGIAHEVLRKQSQLLGWQVAGARAAFALRVLGVVAAVAAALLAGLMLWRASQARGLVIEAFDVPPALAERGLTGKVLATQVQDRLDRMQAQTVTPGAALTVSNRWSGDIAVQIASTGVSLGEIDRLLRQWLGREVHVTGEAYAVTRPDGTPGLALTVRTPAGAGAPAVGTEAGLDAMIQAAAETVLRQTQPVLYAGWLGQHGREAETLPIYRWLTTHGSPEERGEAWLNLFLASPEPPERKYDLIARAGAADRESPGITMLLAGVNYRLGHVESALNYKTRAEQLVRRSARLSPNGRSNMIYASR